MELYGERPIVLEEAGVERLKRQNAIMADALGRIIWILDPRGPDMFNAMHGLAAHATVATLRQIADIARSALKECSEDLARGE